MLPDSALIFSFVLSALLLTLAPGPDIVYVAMRGLSQGWRAGVVAALGLITGIFVHITLAGLGLSVLLASSPILFTIIKYAGAFYIIYIGWQIARSGPLNVEKSAHHPTLGQIYRQTILMNILNPKVALFFLAFLPQFVDPTSTHATAQFIFFGFLFQVCALLVMGSMGIFAGTIASALKQNKAVGLYINRVSGSIVMLLGIFIPAKDIWDFVLKN
ncbi:MAG: LysE family translocator [Sneathiella sp.]|uniref:LysE family translocator n=1 Tax=Sneathiella sp. TaxID=1964365 RepID=UPI00300280A5